MMKIVHQSSKKRTLFFAALMALFIGAFGTYYYYTSQPTSTVTILDFEDTRDTQFILDIFDRDWWWLVSENTTDFSPQYFLEQRGHRGNEGKFTIKVAYQEGKPLGFIAYHKENATRGRILFIDVIPDVRAKGVGYKLFDYAVKDLKKQGATKVVLVTRTTNQAAQKLYKRYGFKEVYTYDGFVDFEYTM